MATARNRITNANGDEGKMPNLADSIEVAGSVMDEEPAVREASVRGKLLAPRSSSDEINRFLLCALVRESSLQIKRAAEKSGVCLPFERVIRRLLDSYGRAASENPGLLSGPKLDSPFLRRLNERLCREEIRRYSRETVSNSKILLAHAKRIGDQTRIRAAEEILEGALLAQDRLAEAE